MNNIFTNIISSTYINKDILYEITKKKEKIINEDILSIIDNYIIWFDKKMIIESVTKKYILDRVLNNKLFYTKTFYENKFHDNKNIDFFNKYFKLITIENFKRNITKLYYMSNKIQNFFNDYDITFNDLKNENDIKKINSIFNILRYLCIYNFSAIEISSLFVPIDDYIVDFMNEYSTNKKKEVENLVTNVYTCQIESLIDKYIFLKNSNISIEEIFK